MPNRCPRLLAISDRETLGSVRFEAWVRALAAAGVDGLQIRSKDASDADVLEQAMGARDAFPRPRLLVVNRRVDIALLASADGVHLPAAGVPTAALRRRFGDLLLIGRSTHSADEVLRARDDGADYVTFGPIFETPSKSRYGAPPGLAGLEEAAAHGLPVLALGGITAERLGAVAEAGAWGVAGITMFHRLEDLPRLAGTADELFGLHAAGGASK